MKTPDNEHASGNRGESDTNYEGNAEPPCPDVIEKTPICEPLQGRTCGYFEATRSQDALTLIQHYPLAYVLAAVIAHRARWHNDGFNPYHLTIGEALLGNFESYGITESQYRTAKKVLKEGGFATFKPTTKGTIAKLTDTRLFKINPSKRDGLNTGRATGVATDTVTTNLKPRATKRETAKAFSTKGSKLTAKEKELADRFETALGVQWPNDAGKWVNRIKAHFKDCESVIGEVESAVRESRIDTTPAQFAEHFWSWLIKQPLADEGTQL